MEKALLTAKDDSLRAEYMADQGWDLMSMRRNKEAKTVLLEAYALDSTSGAVMNNLGVVTDDLGQTNEANNWIAKFIALDTTETTGYLNMGFLLARSARYEEALTYYAKAEKMGAKDFPTLSQLFPAHPNAALQHGQPGRLVTDVQGFH